MNHLALSPLEVKSAEINVGFARCVHLPQVLLANYQSTSGLCGLYKSFVLMITLVKKHNYLIQNVMDFAGLPVSESIPHL